MSREWELRMAAWAEKALKEDPKAFSEGAPLMSPEKSQALFERMWGGGNVMLSPIQGLGPGSKNSDLMGSPKNPSTGTSTTTARPKRSPEEQSILDVSVRQNGPEWTERHAELILRQAREIGDL